MIKKCIVLLMTLALMTTLISACNSNAPTTPPAPTATFTATNTACANSQGTPCTPTFTATATPSGTNTSTGTPTLSPTQTLTPSATGTPTGTPTQTPTVTFTPTFAATPLPYKTSINTSPWFISGMAPNASGTTIFAGLTNGTSTSFVETLTSGGVSLASYSPAGAEEWFTAYNPTNGNVYATELLLTGTTVPPVEEFTPLGVPVTSWSAYSGGSFGDNYGVAIAPNGDVFVVDGNESRIDVFTSAGVPVTYWGIPTISGMETGGILAVSPKSPYNVYCLGGAFNDTFVYEYSASGSPVTQWGGGGSGFGLFYDPQSLTVDSNGNVYVCDSANGLVQEFDGNGNFLSQLVARGTSIAADANGDIYLAQFNSSASGSTSSIRVYGP